ncbi:MAG: tRNA dihydrouridine synthase [Phycisphaerales bacterium]
MSGCESASKNATPPSSADAPGAEAIDTAAVAATTTIDPRIPELVPGFDAPFFQAGLAGYSDAAMRLIARRHGCPYCVTEALLDRTLLAGGRGFAKADLGELEDNIPGGAEDHPLAGQIMGSTPDEMAAAAIKMVEQGARHDREYKAMAWGVWNPATLPGSKSDRTPTVREGFPHSHTETSSRDAAGRSPSLTVGVLPNAAAPRTFATIDVNLACPVKKIKNKARGGHWLREPEGAIEILRAVRDAVPSDIPCTVKLRRSFDDTPEMAAAFEQIFDAAYELGYAWATVHARTVEQKYVGPSRWTMLRDLCARDPQRIVFGSGDVWNVHDIFRMLAYTGVKAVSVARGCIGNPWVFRQARQMMAGLPPTEPTLEEQRAVLEEHFALSAALHGEEPAGRMMRKFGVRFATHHTDPDAVRSAFIRCERTDDWQKVLREHY